MSSVLTRVAVVVFALVLGACGDKDEGADTSDGDTSAASDTADTAGGGGRGDTGGGDPGGGAGGETGGGGGTSISCEPDQGTFTGDVVPQAGVEWSSSGGSCGVTSGPPPSDQLVIDDFGGVFAGSGTGSRVVAVSHGTFSNEDGFFLLDALPADTEIVVQLEEPDVGEVAVTFEITAGDPAVLTVRSITVAD